MKTLSSAVLFALALVARTAHATAPGRGGAAPAQVIDQLDVRDEGARTVITIRASSRPVFTAFRAVAPNRLVVDVSNARLRGVPSAIDADTAGVTGIGASEMRAGQAPLSRFLVNLRDGATYTVEREPRSIVVTVTAPQGAADAAAQGRIDAAERRALAEEEGRLRAEKRAREAASGAEEVIRDRDRARAALEETQRALAVAQAARAEAERQAQEAGAQRAEAEHQAARASAERADAERRVREVQAQRVAAERLAQQAGAARQEAERARRDLERRARRDVPGDQAALERARADVDRLVRAEAEARAQAARVASESDSAVAAARSAQAAAEERVRQADARAQGADARARRAEADRAAALARSESAEQARRAAEARSSLASAERLRAEESARVAASSAAEQARALAEAERRRATAVAQARAAQAALERTAREAQAAARRASAEVEGAQAAREAAETRAAEEREARLAAQRDAEAARAQRDRSRRETQQARAAAADAMQARANADRVARDVAARRELLAAADRDRAALERRIAQEQGARRQTAAEAAASRRRVEQMEGALARATRTAAERQASLAQAEARLSDARAQSARADVARAESEERARAAERARDEATARATAAEASRVAADRARVAAETRAADYERRVREAESRAALAATAQAAADERAVRAIVAADAARQQAAVAASAARPARPAAPAVSGREMHSPVAAAQTDTARIRDVRFEEREGEQRVLVDLTGDAGVAVRSLGERAVVLEVRGAALPEALERTLDVTAFDGAVHTVSTYRRGEAVLVEVELGAEAQNVLRRDGTRVVWAFRSPTPDPAVARAAETHRAPGARTIHRESPEDYGMISEETASFLSSVPMQARSARGRAAGRYRGRRIDLDFKDADIHNILRLVSEVGRVNIVTSDDVSGTVTIRMRNVPWDQALDVILQSKGLGMERQGNLIRVAPLTILEKEREMAIARRKQQVELEPLETRLVPVSYATAGELSPRAQELLSSRGSLSVDERTNVIIARDVAENLNQIEELVRNLDTQTPQVLIEARIVEANSNYLRELGIQWGGDIEFASATGNPTGLAFPSNVGVAGGATDRATETTGLSPVSNTVANPNFAVNLPAAVGRGSGGAVGISLGSVTNNLNLNLRLSALEATGSGRIISEPRILTLDNREAHIEQGTLIPYSQVSAAGVQTAFQEAKLNLTVRPHVTADGSVLMHIKITRDEPDFNRTGSRGDPTINKREAETELLIEDGRTAVIGGIYTRNSGVQWSQVPFFANIPVLGWFFRNQRTSDLRGELLIFITPRIVNRAESIGP